MQLCEGGVARKRPLSNGRDAIGQRQRGQGGPHQGTPVEHREPAEVRSQVHTGQAASVYEGTVGQGRGTSNIDARQLLRVRKSPVPRALEAVGQCQRGQV